jgi:hypothetical protein
MAKWYYILRNHTKLQGDAVDLTILQEDTTQARKVSRMTYDTNSGLWSLQ